MNWKETKEELKKSWILFLLFGIIILIINTFIQVGLTNWLNEQMRGPPCRVEFEKSSFEMINNTHFSLPYRLVNLMEKDLLLEKTHNICAVYTKEEQEFYNNIEIKISNVVNEVPTPRELEILPASKSVIKKALGCKSPNVAGSYKLSIIVETTEGNCEGNVIMEVKNDK